MFRKSLFKPSEWLRLERAVIAWMGSAAHYAGVVLAMILAGALGLTASGVEISFLLDVFGGLMQEVPGGGTTYSAVSFALMSFIALSAYKIIAIRHPHHRLIRFIEKAVIVCIPLFLLGSWSLLSSIYWDRAEGTVMQSERGAVVWSLPGQDAPPPEEEEAELTPADQIEPWIAWFPLGFVLFAGSVSLMALFVAERSYAFCWTNYIEFQRIRHNRKQCANSITRLREMARRYEQTVCEYNREAAVSREERLIEAACRLLALRDRAVREIEHRSSEDGFDDPVLPLSEGGFERPRRKVPQRALEDLKALSIDEIVQVMSRNQIGGEHA